MEASVICFRWRADVDSSETESVVSAGSPKHRFIVSLASCGRSNSDINVPRARRLGWIDGSTNLALFFSCKQLFFFCKAWPGLLNNTFIIVTIMTLTKYFFNPKHYLFLNPSKCFLSLNPNPALTLSHHELDRIFYYQVLEGTGKLCSLLLILLM